MANFELCLNTCAQVPEIYGGLCGTLYTLSPLSDPEAVKARHLMARQLSLWDTVEGDGEREKQRNKIWEK